MLVLFPQGRVDKGVMAGLFVKVGENQVNIVKRVEEESVCSRKRFRSSSLPPSPLLIVSHGVFVCALR